MFDATPARPSAHMMPARASAHTTNARASAHTINARRRAVRCAPAIKSAAGDGTFEGYASLFNREDAGRDVILPGAFRDSLAARGAAGIRMLFQHDPSEPVGVWETIREDARGLFVRGRLLPGIARAREILALMRAGALDGLSIGFRPVRARRDARTGIRRLEKIDLWEVSIVTFPMLAGARVAQVKARADAARHLAGVIARAARRLGERRAC